MRFQPTNFHADHFRVMLAFAVYALTATAFYLWLKNSATIMEEARIPVEAQVPLRLVEGGAEVRKAA